MLQPRLFASLRAALPAVKPRVIPPSSLVNSTALFRARIPSVTGVHPAFVRHATHQSQGRANGVKDGAGRRLGAKKSGEQFVIPGNIIFRQRGTKWFPGENCAMGRDHTIYATQTGYVKYYRDPYKHPKRQYIGVAFKRDDSLPYPINGARKRKLGMVAVQMETEPSVVPKVAILDAEVEEDGEMVAKQQHAPPMNFDVRPGTVIGPNAIKSEAEILNKKPLTMKGGYMYREANWEIGRAAERANVTVREFVRGDRFAAWRKRNARRAKAVERRAIRRKK